MVHRVKISKFDIGFEIFNAMRYTLSHFRIEPLNHELCASLFFCLKPNAFNFNAESFTIHFSLD